MPARSHRPRLGLEQLEDRCTPSAMLGDPRANYPADSGGPQAARFGSLLGASGVKATRQHAVPVKLAYQCSADISTGKLSASGVATGGVGHWTSQGRLDSFRVAAGWATIKGTTTIVTANGDKLFVSFLSSWELTTGKGHKWITVTGGTGRYAGATGYAFMHCTVTGDPATPSTFRCSCQGVGVLILARR